MMSVIDIVKWIFDCILLIITIIYLIFHRKKGNAIKEIISYNLAVAYILTSVIHFVFSYFDFTEDLMIKIVIEMIYFYLLDSILITIYCFYTYMFSISGKNNDNDNNHYVLYCILSWVIGLTIFTIYLMIALEIIIEQKIVLVLFLGIVVVELIIPLLLIKNFIILWRKYNKAKPNDKDERNYKNKGKVKMLIMGICFIITILLNNILIGSFSWITYENDNSEENENLISILAFMKNKVLFLCNYVMHISFLLLLSYDEDIYQRLFCKSKIVNKNDNINLSLQELFIN